MSLVEVDEHSPNLNLRVFKRAGGVLVLLWNRIKEAQERSLQIRAKSLTLNGVGFEVLPAAYKIDERSPEVPVGPDVIICAINESKAGLDENHNYYFTVEYAGTRATQSIRVTRSGVFPSHEREIRERNVHNYLWDEKGQTWRKQNGVMGKDNRFYAGVILMPCPSCGYKGEETTS